jgi:DNA-binding transcriptional LysR family regulator
MELRHLRYFRVYAEELHFGRAAERLHMEPQPLNFQIRQLERELGFRLSERKENRTQLTAAGRVFAEKVLIVFADVDEAVDAARRAARGESGLLRLGYMDTRMYDYLIPVIRQFREEFPGVSVDFQHHFIAGRRSALMQGRLDIGLSILPTPEAGLNSKPLVEAAPVIAIAARDPLAARGIVKWSELVGRPQVMLPPETASEFQDRAQAMLRDHGLDLPVAQVANEDRALYTLIGMGIGIAIVPFYTRDQPKDVVFLRFPDDAPRFVYGVVWPAAIENALRDRFIELVPPLVLAE